MPICQVIEVMEYISHIESHYCRDALLDILMLPTIAQFQKLSIFLLATKVLLTQGDI